MCSPRPAVPAWPLGPHAIIAVEVGVAPPAIFNVFYVLRCTCHCAFSGVAPGSSTSSSLCPSRSWLCMQVHTPVRRRRPNSWLSFVFWCLLIVFHDTGLLHHDSQFSHSLQGTCSPPSCSQSQDHLQDCTPQLPGWKGNSTSGSPESTGCAPGPPLEIFLGWASFPTTSPSLLDNGQFARSSTRLGLAVPKLQTEVQSGGDFLPILRDNIAEVLGRPDYSIAPWLSLSQSQGSLRPSDMAQGYCPNSFDPTFVSTWGHSCSFRSDFVMPAHAQLTALQLRSSLSFPQLWDVGMGSSESVRR